jgi:GNAT superfamily N-acetyltransferase
VAVADSSLFADSNLAARIDRAEMRLSMSLAETLARRSPDARVLVSAIAGGHAVFAGAGGPANKAIGVGFDAVIDEPALDLIEAEWRDRGEPMRFELSTLADASLAPLLTARGYRLTGFENVSGRAIGPDARVPALPAGVTIEDVPAADYREWMDVTLDAFLAPDGSAPNEEQYPREVLEAIMADFVATPGFTRYLLRVDGVAAGEATMRLDDGIAQLCGAATLPAFRRRGIQSLLFNWRLAAGRAAGCDLAVVTTQPGSKSQANAITQGFSLLYTRAILIKPLDTTARSAGVSAA